jgi:2-C-methyl-D-erythritol 4-phosphate cytidylyltransferase
MKQTTDCIIVAAGSGKRLGAKTPKAFVPLCGKPLFIHSLLVFAGHKSINKIILVVPGSMIKKALGIVNTLKCGKEIVVVKGGEHRWQSVQNGVETSMATWVMVHDSARPFVTHAIIDSVAGLSKKYDAVIAATPEVDTVRKFKGDRAGTTIDRNELVRVQTPQLFKRTRLTDAFKRASSYSSPPTDEAMLMMDAGIPVGLAAGDPLNFKVTTREDLTLATALLKNRQ